MEQNWEHAIQKLIQAYDETRGIFLPMEFKEQIEAVSTNMKQIKKTYLTLRPTNIRESPKISEETENV